MKKKKLLSFLLAGALALTGLQPNLTVREASAAAGADLSAFVALDTRITEIHAWLSGLTKTADTLTDDGFPTQFALICISLTYK